MTAKTVKVLYKFVDGAHFFVSDDEETLGLCVAHKDAATAFAAVSSTLTKLFNENYGENIHFTPSLSFQAFMEWFVERSETAMTKPSPGAAGLLQWNPNDNGVAA